MSKAIKTFNEWAYLGKDLGMEKNHSPSVIKMLDLIPNQILSKNFSFIDIGCGNGWVVRKIKSKKNCIHSVGIDGAEKMIKKAISLDKNSEYFNLNIEKMNYKNSFDVVFSMEVFYYFKNPLKVLKYINNYIIKSGGCMLVGVDHYFENTSSLSWSDALNLKLQTYKIEEWKALFKDSGFKNVKTFQFGKKDSWEGTLVIYCEK
tara:strand:- start:604 stop:1215 length:612 start_codon:yes stop_codon:yes gene_type:complete